MTGIAGSAMGIVVRMAAEARLGLVDSNCFLRIWCNSNGNRFLTIWNCSFVKCFSASYALNHLSVRLSRVSILKFQLRDLAGIPG
jgi:hypothetical protein